MFANNDNAQATYAQSSQSDTGSMSNAKHTQHTCPAQLRGAHSMPKGQFPAHVETMPTHGDNIPENAKYSRCPAQPMPSAAHASPAQSKNAHTMPSILSQYSAETITILAHTLPRPCIDKVVPRSAHSKPMTSLCSPSSKPSQSSHSQPKNRPHNVQHSLYPGELISSVDYVQQ